MRSLYLLHPCVKIIFFQIYIIIGVFILFFTYRSWLGESYYWQGTKYHRQKNYEAAIDNFLKASKSFPWEDRYYVWVAISYEHSADQKNISEDMREFFLHSSKKYYEKVISLIERDLWAYSGLARIYAKLSHMKPKDKEYLIKYNKNKNIAHKICPYRKFY